VAGIVQQAVAPPPTYYQPAPVYYPQAQAPTVVYRQPGTVVYQQQQPTDGQVIYEQPNDGYQGGYQDGY
jgi:hypothetical protein